MYAVTVLKYATVVGYLPRKLLKDMVTHLHLVLSTGLVLKISDMIPRKPLKFLS